MAFLIRYVLYFLYKKVRSLSFAFILPVQTFRQIEEEVVPQYPRDTFQQCRVYRWTAEYVVNIGAFTMQLPGKPCRSARFRLPCQLGLYHLSHMNHHLLRASHSCHARPLCGKQQLSIETKKRRTMCSLSYTRHRQTPSQK